MNEKQNVELSPDDKLKLLGLRVIAREHMRGMKAVHAAVCSITREPADSAGHSDDYVWSAEDERISPEELWERTAPDRIARAEQPS